MTTTRIVDSPRVWASLITNLSYLPGLLTLHHTLQSTSPADPFIALYTSSFPASGLAALAARNIPAQLVPRLQPTRDSSRAADPRFEDCWTKLAVFSLTGYDRIILLDCDMLVRANMDELMALPLDPSSASSSSSGAPSSSSAVLAAGHACLCNPLRKKHYPPTWTPANCAFTTQHSNPRLAQLAPPDPAALSFDGGLNTGLLVVRPDADLYAAIVDCMELRGADFTFPDQDLLSTLFAGRWRPLPYVYNALKTMRWDGVHDKIWRDDQVRNVHYILSPKPWDELDAEGNWTGSDESHKWWVDANNERKRSERAGGILDGF